MDYILTQTGQEVQELLNQVAPNQQAIAQEANERTLAVMAETDDRISADNDLQRQIDELVAGDATVNLTASHATIFAGVQTAITLTATTNKNASAIVIKKGGTTLGSGSGTSKAVTDTVTPDASGTIAYSAEFTISGNERTASRDVSVVNKIYYGIGGESIADYQEFASGAQTKPAQTTPNGSYTYTPTAEASYIYILEPYAMAQINLANVKLGDLGYNLKLVTDNATIDGARYRVYRSVADNQPVQFTISVNN